MHELTEGICCHNAGRRKEHVVSSYVFHSCVWNKGLWYGVQTIQAAGSKYFIFHCKRGHELQSLFSIQLMFVLLNAAPRDPVQMEVMCDEAGFSPWRPNKVDLLRCPDPPRWPRHPGRPRSGLVHVAANNSPACSPCRLRHVGVGAPQIWASWGNPSQREVQSLLPHWEQRTNVNRQRICNESNLS